MPKSSTARATAPDTVWLARGRHLGPGAEQAVRQRLRDLKSDAVIQDHLEFDGSCDGPSGAPATSDAPGTADHVFEARWLVDDQVVVRARLTLGAPGGIDDARDWVLVAEAERPWDLGWPSPATVFWPEDSGVPWDHDVVHGLRFRETNRLPADDRALRRLLKDCVRRSWSIHVIVHEAMTPDERGRLPLVPLLPPGVRHRVVEHRAAPGQFQVVNWALDGLGARVPRGGAVVLPATPGGSGDRPGDDGHAFAVRTVFLDGSRPTELIDAVRRCAESPRPLPEGAEAALTGLRERWHLMTPEEELAQARRQIAAYAEALDAMTKSRDLYREAAELAHEALAAYRESSGPLPASRREPGEREGLSFRDRLAMSLDRVREGARLLRAPASDGQAPGGAGTDEAAESGEAPSPAGSPETRDRA
ncbi:hypothetical protein ACFSL4_00180 [Streptomyces caeni]|uniref:PE-PGRS family protein n=1 Tax=Streptomyces caeni TaxID=2307231 RepID=A0ABW4IJ92_9ACTN